MAGRMPWDITAAGADGEKAAPAARPRPGRHLIAVMLLAAAVLDLTRCGLVLAAARHPAPAAGLVAAGLAATVLSVRTARGCQAGQRWAGWEATRCPAGQHTMIDLLAGRQPGHQVADFVLHHLKSAPAGTR